MSLTLLLMLLVPFVVLAASTAWVVRYRNRLAKLADAQAPQWEEVARQFGLTYERPSPAAGYVKGTLDGRELTATVIKRGRGAGGTLLTQVAVNHSSPLGLDLYVAPRSWPRPGKRVTTGDPSFDDAFDVTTKNPPVVSRLLDDKMRQAIRQLQSTAGLKSVNDRNVLTEFESYGIDGDTLARTFRLQIELCEELGRGLERAASGLDEPRGLQVSWGYLLPSNSGRLAFIHGVLPGRPVSVRSRTAAVGALCYALGTLEMETSDEA